MTVFLGGLDGIGQKWAGHAPAPEGQEIGTPPPGMFMTPSLSNIISKIGYANILMRGKY